MLPDLPPQVVAALADTPLVLVLVWMLFNLRREVARGAEAAPPPPPPPAMDTAREELAAFKLEVARTYVPLSLIRDLDARLTQQLGRLEEKLDEVSRAATAAAALSGQQVSSRSIGFGARATESR